MNRKYLLLAALGMFLYLTAAIAALAHRGYMAVGGEIFLPPLPLACYLLYKEGTSKLSPKD